MKSHSTLNHKGILMATFSDYIKNIFWVLVLLQFAPRSHPGHKEAVQRSP